MLDKPSEWKAMFNPNPGHPTNPRLIIGGIICQINEWHPALASELKSWICDAKYEKIDGKKSVTIFIEDGKGVDKISYGYYHYGVLMSAAKFIYGASVELKVMVRYKEPNFHRFSDGRYLHYEIEPQ